MIDALRVPGLVLRWRPRSERRLDLRTCTADIRRRIEVGEISPRIIYRRGINTGQTRLQKGSSIHGRGESVGDTNNYETSDTMAQGQVPLARSLGFARLKPGTTPT